MSAFEGKADIIQGKADIKKCPLMTQSGHQADVPSRTMQNDTSGVMTWSNGFYFPKGQLIFELL
jgi:hypothetical protein